MFMLGFALMGTTVVLPLFVQTLLGYTAEQAGMVRSPGGFATMLMMPAAGALSGRIDARLLITVGLIGTAIAMFHLSGFDLNVDFSTLAWARVYQSLGLALLFIPINTAAYQGITAEKNANASAIINMMRNLGGSVGIAILSTYIARRQQANQVTLIRHVTPYSFQTNQMLKQLQQAFVAAHGSAGGALRQAQAELYAIVQQQAAVLSYLDAFWLVGAVLVAMIPLVLLLRKPVPAAAPPLHCRRTPFARCRRCHPGTRLSLQKGCASAAIQGAANGRSRHARVSSEERRRSVLTPDSRIAIIGLMGFDPCRRSQYPRRNARTWAIHSAGFSKGGQWPQLLSRTRRELAMWLRIAIETSKGTIRS